MPEPTVQEMRKRLGELIDWVAERAPGKAVQLDAVVAWLEADAITRQAGLKGLSVEDGAALLELDSPRELIVAWVHAARDWLGEAPNYTETRFDFPREGSGVSMTVSAAGEAERYVFTLQRAGKTTPHEARAAAEAELAAARREIERLEGELDDAQCRLGDLQEMAGRAEGLRDKWADHPDQTIARVCRTVLGEKEPEDG